MKVMDFARYGNRHFLLGGERIASKSKRKAPVRARRGTPRPNELRFSLTNKGIRQSLEPISEEEAVHSFNAPTRMSSLQQDPIRTREARKTRLRRGTPPPEHNVRALRFLSSLEPIKEWFVWWFIIWDVRVVLYHRKRTFAFRMRFNTNKEWIQKPDQEQTCSIQEKYAIHESQLDHMTKFIQNVFYSS